MVGRTRWLDELSYRRVAPSRGPQLVMFAGRYGDEATLFRLASQIEKAQPWFDRVPAL